MLFNGRKHTDENKGSDLSKKIGSLSSRSRLCDIEKPESLAPAFRILKKQNPVLPGFLSGLKYCMNIVIRKVKGFSNAFVNDLSIDYVQPFL